MFKYFIIRSTILLNLSDFGSFGNNKSDNKLQRFSSMHEIIAGIFLLYFISCNITACLSPLTEAAKFQRNH